MKHHKHSHSRRDFLSLLGQLTALPLMQSPVQILIESIVAGAVTADQARAQGLNPRRLLQISHEGAPPRWGYDLFLNPYSKTFTPHAGVGSRISDDAKSVVYSTVERKGLNVPHMWQYNVPRVGGGTRPMDDLLNNMVCLRGINIGNPAHGGAQAALSVPTGATQSISALSGDASSAPIASINSNLNQFRYLSKSSKSSVTLANSGNMLETLLNPFIRKDLGGFTIKRESLDAALDASVAALNASAEALHPKAEAISKSLDSAKQLMSQGFGNLDQIWSDLTNKYLVLIAQALSPTQSLSGINDKAVLSDGSRLFMIDQIIVSKGADLRTMITTKTACDRMASTFAMVEYVLLNNLSSSVSIGSSVLTNLSVNGDDSFVHSFDEHNTGAPASVISNTYLNLAFSACLLELIDQLKAKGIFEETLIVSGAEFGRSPHGDGVGSDHGYSGGSSILLSGALQSQPMVLGNIYSNKKQDADDNGTWGYGAPVAELGKELSPAHWAATIASVLRVGSPVSTAASVLVDQGGVFKPTIELAKQVSE